MDIQNSNMSAQEKMKQTYLVFGQIAVQGKKLTDQMGAQARMDGMPTANRAILKFAQLTESGGEAAYVAMMKEQDITKQNQGLNVSLMAAQERMIVFGNKVTLMLAGVAAVIGEDLMKLGFWIMTNLIDGLFRFTNWLKSDEVKLAWAMVTDFFQKVVLPKLGLIYDWFVLTWNQLKDAWGGNGPKTIIEVLKDRLADGMKNIWADMQAIWKVVSPGLIEIWNKDIKPVIISMWNSLLDTMLSSIGNAVKNWMFGPKQETGEGATNYKFQDEANQKAMNWWQTGIVKYQEANEFLLGLLSKDVAERVKNQRVIDQNQYLKENGQLPRTINGARASGGLVEPGTYLVGERGPELLGIGDQGNVTSNTDFNALLNKMAIAASANNDTASSLGELNNTMKQLVRHAADTSDYARRTVSAIAQISGDIMPTI